MKLRISVSCDDVNPSPQYRILGTPVEKWMRQLNDEFGVKYTLFVPSCYHDQWPISKEVGWIKELNDSSIYSVECHGHLHMTSNPRQYGEMEFFELQDDKAIAERIEDCAMEWQACGFDISEMGWRSPGWIISEQSKGWVESSFKWAAIHYEHNHGMSWKCPTFFGHDGIQMENISVHNEDIAEGGMIMFTSHVAGKHNHNVWNRENFEQLRLSLTHLFETYEIEPKFLRECL